jgi:hypothetical protein
MEGADRTLARVVPGPQALVAIALGLVLALSVAVASPQAASPPAAPAALTAIALDGKVRLSWQPSAGATGYSLYRGSSPGAITQRITPAGFSGTTFLDTSAPVGQPRYYAVKASNSDGESSAGQVAQASASTRSCSTGNAIVVENCFQGSAGWKVTNGVRAQARGIDAYASASSINAGGSVEVRVMADWGAPYRIEIYRTGGYGGQGGRLISTIPGLAGDWAPSCFAQPDSTGLYDCASWPVAARIQTSTDWTSGVYTLKLVREDNGTETEVPLVVRNDGSQSDVLYGVSTSTYQAYNRFGGKSTYTGQSSPPATVSGANRAVKVSFDRPYAQATSGPEAHDWYTRTDVGTVRWLESQGYDVSYIASEDLHTAGAQLTDHRVYISGSHDEYWSQQMSNAVVQARNAGTSLVFMGANADYWRVRFEASPVSGQANRVMVVYKTIESGPADPSGISTSTWRDPAGPNQPENAIIGQMYIGDNSSRNFPLEVSASQGQHPVWRHTPLASLAPGTAAQVGTQLVGWEWDARAANGREPAGVATLASSPVQGNLVQGNGASYTFGNATAAATIYRAASGADVFATGTNNWWRGLARNRHDEGEPNQTIQQATVNVLSDMGAYPTTPAAGIVIDDLGPLSVTGRSPASGATGVQTDASVQADFDRALDPASVDNGDLTLTGPGGASVSGAVALANGARSLVLSPSAGLAPFTSYSARIGTGVRSWDGVALGSPVTWSFTTGAGTPPALTDRTPAPGATGVATDAGVRAVFDRSLDPSSVNSATFSLRPAAGGAAISAEVSYDAASRSARLTPAQPLAPATGYRAELTTGIRAADGTPMVAAQSWTFTTAANLAVTDRSPAPFATGVAPSTTVRAVFSRPANAATITSSSFSLTDSSGQPVVAQVSYDATSNTAILTPSSTLSLGATYTVRLTAAIRAADGAPLDGSTWSFTTALSAPPPPVPTQLQPSAGSTNVPVTTPVTASFDRALDSASVNTQSFTLRPEGGQPVLATVSYESGLQRAVLTPQAELLPNTRYIASLSTTIRSSAGAPLASETSWGFTTALCPCNLMGSMTPAQTHLPVQDYRPGPGPFSYELGTRITADQRSSLVALRFYKDAGETGTHVGRVWSSSGQQLAQVTFTGESASGWQRQSLSTPLTLQPGQTYTVSVGLNAYYSKTVGGLSAQLSNGPLRSVVGGNGVYANSAGQYPSNSWQSSNYFVDAAVVPDTSAAPPEVETVSPTDGATSVSVSTSPTARFSTPLDAATVTPQTVTLTRVGGASVAATVSYDSATRTVTLTPQAALSVGASYTMRLDTGIRGADGTALAAPVSWTFSTVAGVAPVVTQTSPAQGATAVEPGTSVTATFSEPMDASTLTSGAFTVSGPGGASVTGTVSYDAASRTASFVPSAELSSGTVYTARVGTAARSAQGVTLAQPYSWTFSTSGCPCRLFQSDNPDIGAAHLSTQNFRSGTGPWSLELGVKISVTTSAELQAVRFWKDSLETGAHVGRVWNEAGTLLASTTFGSETASGWQESPLATPLALVPGQTYVVSVGYNAYFGMKENGLADAVVSGPLRSVADGRNGVYGDAAGTFPTRYWHSSNYWVDAVVR